MSVESVVKLAYEKFNAKTEMTKKKLAELSKDSLMPATVLVIAGLRVHSRALMLWEPESLWLTMEDVSVINQGKILAAVALDLTPIFFSDERAFSNTVKVLNDELTQPDRIPECTAAEVAWGAFEGQLIFAMLDNGKTQPKFYETVSAYVAAVLHHEGLVLVPDGLEFAEPFLEKLLNDEAKKLQVEAKKAWTELPKEDLQNHVFEETPLGSQLFRRAASALYLMGRMDHLITELQKL